MVEKCPRTRFRKHVEVIPSVNTIESVENVVVDDEAEIEQEDEKFDDRDVSDNERDESDRDVNQKDDDGKERDEVDIEDKADSVNEAEESEESPSDQFQSENEQEGLNGCFVSQPKSQLGGDESGGESVDHSKSGNGEETTQRMNDFEETCFGPFLKMSKDWSFNGELVHNILIHRIMKCDKKHETEVHHFLVPTHKETYQSFMRDFVPLGQDFSDKRIDSLRKELEGATTIKREKVVRGVGGDTDVFGGGSRDGVGPYGSVDVERVSAGGIGTSRHTVGCSHCVYESPALNKVLEEVEIIRVSRLEHHGKSNLKGGIHEQSLEGSADQIVKTLDL
ncbi:hypothetical protein K7X08_000933 [Anisodus acutangulus]|uniref:Uncharacterized protein n=1 Tax=Anisodus acutangulus TaxID=402998 RepID=A0A9Q1RNL4_9SOLA|nr:hypothetical protein K7X08_000933 [Anisodus acutangulus]